MLTAGLTAGLTMEMVMAADAPSDRWSARKERFAAELQAALAPQPFLTDGELQAMLRRPEDVHLERKALWHRTRAHGRRGRNSRRRIHPAVVRRMIAHYGAAFANSEGGMLLLGVDDDGTPSGHGYQAPSVLSFILTARGLGPDLAVEAQVSMVEGAEVLVLRFGVSPRPVRIAPHGDVPFRTRDTTRQVPFELVAAAKRLALLEGRLPDEAFPWALDGRWSPGSAEGATYVPNGGRH